MNNSQDQHTNPLHPPQMISFGAGVNSTAMIILLAELGWRGPIVFAHTGAEHPETYSHIAHFQEHYLTPRNLTITHLRPGSPYHTRMSQAPLETYCLENHRIPHVFPRWCTSRWKTQPLDRWANTHNIHHQLCGITSDEAHRTDKKRPHLRFPLVESHITRDDCRQIITAAGLPIPPKSRCFFCPFQTINEWRTLYHQHPDLYRRARRLELNAHTKHGRPARLNQHHDLAALARRFRSEPPPEIPCQTPAQKP